jgi:hypothetical protein
MSLMKLVEPSLPLPMVQTGDVSPIARSSRKLDLVLQHPGCVLDTQELGYIQDALAADGFTHTLNDIQDLIRAEKVQFWKITGLGVEGVALTEIISFPRFYELFIWLLAGKNMIWYADEILQKFMDLAEAMKCRRVRGLATPELAKALKKKTAMRTLHESLVLEVKHK